jgi:large conductance mechanosensitive channel
LEKLFNLNFNIMGFIQDFKAFALKGNVVDMAVGVIIGGAFGKIVTSVVNDIIMPPLGLLIGGVNFKDLKWVMQDAKPEVLNEVGEVIKPAVNEVTLNYGNFLQQTFDFIIIALSIFVTIRVITKLTEKRKKEEAAAAAAAPAPAPKPSNEEVLLTEIRDLLKEKK